MSGHVLVCLLSSLILSISPSLVSKMVPSFTRAHTHIRVGVGQAAWWHSTTVIICDPDHFSLQRECGKTSNCGGGKMLQMASRGFWATDALKSVTFTKKKAEGTLWTSNSARRFYPNKCLHYLPCSFKGTVQKSTWYKHSQCPPQLWRQLAQLATVHEWIYARFRVVTSTENRKTARNNVCRLSWVPRWWFLGRDAAVKVCFGVLSTKKPSAIKLHYT